MLLELIELTAATISSGVVGVIGYSIGKKKGKTEPLPKEQEQNLEKELEEVEKYLNSSSIQDNKETNTPKKQLEVIEWEWYDVGRKGKSGFKCPKCQWTNGAEDDHPTICQCTKYGYDKPHFHFICKVCKFVGIMKSADDTKKEKEPKPSRIKWARKLMTALGNDERKWYFDCPKCAKIDDKNEEGEFPQFCQCDSTDHYHFICKYCGFKALMDPAT